MPGIIIDYTRPEGPVKPMHAVNNGPLKARDDQTRGNFDTYKAARIPMMRTHDASFFAGYGGEHTVDVHMIFPDFDADPNDPASYDFVLTDEYMENTLAAGTGVLYRLGSKIEHETKKYGTLPPKDFRKWAVVCEHIIRHMNEGWADGHAFGIRYWEIWNEPDLGPKCWGGTEEEFFELYEITARHLKACFPELMIGGPAVCGRLDFARAFLDHMAAASPRVPLDFFSWHIYAPDPDALGSLSRAFRRLLDEHGYTETESILDEYNFVLDWSPRFIESVQAIIGMKGAAFTASAMLACQHEPVDMLMYYDARPCIFNGMWDFYTMRPLKGYWPFVMFSGLYALGTSVSVTSDSPSVKAVGARDADGGRAAMLSYFRYEGGAPVTIALSLPGWEGNTVRVRRLDESVTMEESVMALTDGGITLTMGPNTVLYLEK